MKTRKHKETCVSVLGRVMLEGRVTPMGRVNVDGLMGLSVTGPSFRSITKDSRWRNVQDLFIKERLDEL